MTPIDSKFHWSNEARIALNAALALTPNGCGSCAHVGWGAQPGTLKGTSKVNEREFPLIACAKGAAVHHGGKLQVQEWCTLWNELTPATEPPPIPESISGAAQVVRIVRRLGSDQGGAGPNI